MRGSRYVKVSYPWDATIDLSSPHPTRFYVSLIAQTLEYGAPAARRFGRAWALVGRTGFPEGPVAALLRRAGAVLKRGVPLAGEEAAIRDAWPALRAEDPSLPPVPERLGVLQLARASATTTFFFDGPGAPVLVTKRSLGPDEAVPNEVAALREAATSGLAPRYLGEVGGAEVQRGLSGRALKVVPIRARSSPDLRWTDQHRSLAAGLETLARTTVKAAGPTAMSDGVIEEAAGHPLVSETTRRAVAEAHASLREVPVSVLRHTDTSPQNILFENGRLTGLVDWEDATSLGVPGADMWNAALACIDKGVGLVRLTERDLFLSFLGAWFQSEFGREARRAGRAAAAAAGIPEELHAALELLFFARRVGHRMRRPQGFLTSAQLSARMLEHVRAQPL